MSASTVAAAYYSFWSSFGLPAYMESNVPNDAEMPYITYTIPVADWSEAVAIQGRIWYRATDLDDISAKIGQISVLVGNGLTINLADGVIYLFKGSPFAQMEPPGDPSQKIAYITLIAHTVTV